MESLKLDNYLGSIQKRIGEPRNQREFFIEKIRKMLGNRFTKDKKTGEFKDTGRLWSYSELGVYLQGIPLEWLKQYYTSSVDAQVPARHFCWLVKETRKS